MPKPFETWTVLPHGKLTPVDDNLLTVTGEMNMPLVDFPRRMTVARLQDGRGVIFSAIALNETEMAQLEAFAVPAFIVVPNERHRMDVKIYKDRYPLANVIAPPGAKSKVEELVRVDGTSVDFSDPRVKLMTVPGTYDRELALEVHTRAGTTLVINELIFNVADQPGFMGMVAKAMGMTGEAKIPAVTRMSSIDDKPALAQQLRRWAKIDDLKRILVSHGDAITREPRELLTRLADQLAPA